MPIQVTQEGELITAPGQVRKIRSEAMQEMISHRPGFLSRWSLLLFVFFLILILTGAWFIHYPEIITAKATLTGTNAPKEIITRQEGKIIKLFVKNNDEVKKGTVLAWVESNADHAQVIDLSARLDTASSLLQAGKTDQVMQILSKNFSQLGELQTNYQDFSTIMQQFNDYLSNGFYFKKRAMLQGDLGDIKRTKSSLQEQKKLLQQDLHLMEENFKANESLYNDKVISKQEYRDITSKLVDKKMTIPKLDASVLSNETQEREKQKEIADMEHAISQQKLIFQQAIQTLRSAVDNWKMKYLLTASIDGSVSFTIPVEENRFVKTGMLLGFINPNAGNYFAEVIIPQNNFGKVDTMQQVQLRFDGYPYNEFGYVKGKLKYISGVATDSGVLAYVELPDNLVTTLHKNITYKNGLTAQAVIITNDMRLLQRFYNNISKLVSR